MNTAPRPTEPSSDAERHILDCLEADRVADFTGRPAAERRVAAAFIAALVAGTGDCKRTPNALRLRGADVVGPLRLLPGSDSEIALLFWSCRFDEPVDLSGGNFLALRFVRCEAPALIGASLTTRADLDLSGSRFTGVSGYECELSEVGTCAIHLSNARIGGRLVMRSIPDATFETRGVARLVGARIEGSVLLDGARLDGDGDAALDARSMTVGGNVSCDWGADRRFEAVGEVAFAAAHVTGDVTLRGARLVGSGGRALHCEDLKVESVFLTGRGETPFEASGRLNFLSATIGGSFFLSRARLAPGPNTGLFDRAGPVAVNLQQLRVSNTLVLNNVWALPPPDEDPARNSLQPVQGWLLLTGAELNGILDDPETGWPAPGYLDLEGASYQRLRSRGGGNDLVALRTRWLRRQFPNWQPTAATFRPQPYEQLSRVLRQHGQAREASAIAVEKIRMRLAAGVDPAWARLFPKLLMLVSHHGYSSARAILSFLVFVLLGAGLYSVALWGFAQPFVPYETDPVPVEYLFPFDLARVTIERGCPGLDVLHFALDAALPVINLGQDNYCRFAPEGQWRWLWLLLHALYVMAGTALSAVVVLTLTGVLRRD